MGNLSALLLAGGSGTRLNGKQEKQFIKLAGKPLIYYSLKLLLDEKKITEIVVVYKRGTSDLIKKIIHKYFKNSYEKFFFTEGGATRQESVFNGLKMCKFETVLIHESARPFVSKIMLQNIISSEYKNITFGVDIPFTVLQKTADDKLSAILQRDNIFNVQLPQKFETAKILQAHKLASRQEKIWTDDSSLFFEILKEDVKILKGSSTNIKITEKSDLLVGRKILKIVMRT